MKKGSIRSLVPEAYANCREWPKPDEDALLGDIRTNYQKRKEAVEMYVSGASFGEIYEHTTKSVGEVRRLVSRCVASDGEGRIFGFHALVLGRRIKGYVRNAAIVPHQGKHGKAGYAGALTKIFREFPSLEMLVQEHFFGARKDSLNEARASYLDVHDTFLKELRKLGMTPYCWPFNTSNRGYNALRNYLQALLERECPQGGIKARYGRDAANIKGVGSGQKTLIPLLRPYSTLQLDFHKEDAAGIIIITNNVGEEIEIPVARWHIGFLVEEKHKAIVGLYISLEMTPTGDCVLETVESALRPEHFLEGDVRCALAPDGRILLAQLIPELAFQGFAMLKVDNAWSNAATEVLNDIISTIGCAMNFGPVRAWWRRHLVESIIGKITQRGLQRVTSTYGTGTGDTKKDDPNGKAIKFRIMLSELIAIAYGCCKEYNEKGNEGNQFSSPYSATKTALARPESGLFRQPLPWSVQKDLRLMMHVEVCTVRGNLRKRVAPYVQSDRCRYHNPTLSKYYHLIGKKLILYIDRRTCETHASVKETGEFLGLMTPEAKWASPCPWRLRKLINRSGLAKAYQHTSNNIVDNWGKQKKKELFEQRRSASKQGRKKSSKAALDIAKFEQSTNYNAQKTDQASSSPSQETPPPNDPFGLGNYSKPDDMKRGL